MYLSARMLKLMRVGAWLVTLIAVVNLLPTWNHFADCAEYYEMSTFQPGLESPSQYCAYDPEFDEMPASVIGFAVAQITYSIDNDPVGQNLFLASAAWFLYASLAISRKDEEEAISHEQG